MSRFASGPTTAGFPKPALSHKPIVRGEIGELLISGVVVAPLGTSCQIGLNNLLGRAFDLKLFLFQLPSFLPLLVLGPLSEELGWRGYAQDRLQVRWSPLLAGIIVGIVWAFWHLPLFFMPGTSQHELGVPFFGFLFGVVSLSLVFAWLHNHSGASIWTAIFFHWIYTYAAQVVSTGVNRNAVYNWLEYTPYILAALVIAISWSAEAKHRLSNALGA